MFGLSLKRFGAVSRESHAVRPVRSLGWTVRKYFCALLLFEDANIGNVYRAFGRFGRLGIPVRKILGLLERDMA